MDVNVMLPMLERDLKSIGLPVEEVEIYFATKYSKTYYALYYPKTDKKEPFIRIYPYRLPNGRFTYQYEQILDTAIHEMCHHLQFRDESYTRIKGVVHDENFWKLYHQYVNRAETAGLIVGGEEDVESCSKSY